MSEKELNHQKSQKITFTFNKSDYLSEYSFQQGFMDNPSNTVIFNGLEGIVSVKKPSETLTIDTNEKKKKLSINDKQLDIIIKGQGEKDEYLETVAYKFIQSLRYHPFDSGNKSFADLELQLLKHELEESKFYLLIQKVCKKCFELRTNTEMLHYLNCLHNLAKEVDTDIFFNCGIVAINHKDIEIKEAGIALFEKMKNKDYASVLENLSDTGIAWLDDYKKEVISDLKELQ